MLQNIAHIKSYLGILPLRAGHWQSQLRSAHKSRECRSLTVSSLSRFSVRRNASPLTNAATPSNSPLPSPSSADVHVVLHLKLILVKADPISIMPFRASLKLTVTYRLAMTSRSSCNFIAANYILCHHNYDRDRKWMIGFYLKL